MANTNSNPNWLIESNQEPKDFVVIVPLLELTEFDLTKTNEMAKFGSLDQLMKLLTLDQNYYRELTWTASYFFNYYILNLDKSCKKIFVQDDL